MKQSYQKPELEIIEFNPATTIATSGTPDPNAPGGAAYYEEV